jgi:hypothetical protein
MPTVSDDGSFVTFTDDEAAKFAAAGGPDAAYLDELINDYALAHGGDVLAVWECIQGPRLGKKIKWSPMRIPAHVGISHSRMDQILDETIAAVWPVWEASPQYARWTKTHHCGPCANADQKSNG